MNTDAETTSVTETATETPKGFRRALSLTQSELRVLGFFFAMLGMTYEVLFQQVERLGYLGTWAALLGVSTLWKSPDPPARE